VRLVCVAVNFGMGQWDEEVFLTLAQAAVEREKQRPGWALRLPMNSKRHAVDWMKKPGNRFSTALL
jgi:hypothetical protein